MAMPMAAALEEALRLHRAGRLRDAAARYAEVLAVEPGNAAALHYAGVVRYQSGDPVGAIDLIRRSIAVDQAPAEPWANLAQALDAMNRPEAAINALKEAARRAPLQPEIWSNLAAAESALGLYADAESSARKALAVDSTHAAAWHNLAMVLEPQGRLLEALDAASRAAALAPEAMAHAGYLAQLQEELGQLAAAAKTLDAALARWPTAAALRSQRGHVLERSGDLPGAAREFGHALRVAPDDGPALSQLAFLQKRLCDWGELASLQARFRNAVAAGTPWLTPFSLLSDPSTRAQQLACARAWSAQFVVAPIEPAPRIAEPGKRLRIGYLSSDFYDHPTAVLMAGLLERHNRDRVEVVAYSTGPNDGSALRARVAAAVDRFVEAQGEGSAQLAARIRRDAIDILVDLKGHTEGAPTAALAYRPAPVQAHFLGYPGTLGAPFVDYLIGDPVVTPLAETADYAETLVQLPGSYQVNDRSRAPSAPPDRAALGLPADAVVLCCFNATYKLNPDVADAWSQIVQAAPTAVLWLLARDANDPAAANLRREFTARGVDPARLVFATRRPQADYLALYHHADLFLDTWPYNAHTTASDALWMGVPVVTWRQQTFAGRVGASLLTAAGLPELVTETRDAYVARALRLAGDADARSRLRERLLGAGRASPLFDAERTARALEAAYERMAEQQRSGRRAPIVVDPARL
jgi:predicted O-linked N-acetylglucosamine transferase (SPINDLY family)